ncbi:MAG: ABC transporter permease [Spirochaetaceae bacterium]
MFRENRRQLLSVPGVTIIVLFALIPLGIMILSSFQAEGGGALSFDHYRRFFSRDFYLSLTWKTVRTSLAITLLSLVLAYPLAYITAKVLPTLRALFLFLILLPVWISELIRAYSWLVLLRDGGVLAGFLQRIGIIESPELGILFTPAAYMIALAHIFFPFMVISIYMAIERIDDRLIEASQMLGARPVHTFFRVVLPLSRPGVISGFLLVFVPCLGAFVEPRILGGTRGTLIGTIIEDQFFEIYGWNFGAAIGTLLLIFIFAVIFILRRLSYSGQSEEQDR